MYLSPTSLFWQTGLDVFFPLWFSVKQVGFNYVWILRLGSELAGSFIIFVRNGIPLNSWFLPIRCCWILQFIWEKYSDISLGNYYITITVLGYVLMWGFLTASKTSASHGKPPFSCDRNGLWASMLRMKQTCITLWQCCDKPLAWTSTSRPSLVKDAFLGGPWGECQKIHKVGRRNSQPKSSSKNLT